MLEPVGSLIHEVRGERVMLDSDLARVYGVATKSLNRAVKRNLGKFPPDFMFQLTPAEAETLRCQIGTSNPGRGGRRTRPFAFTEHGAIMAASVLNSPRAVEMSVHVIRAFVTLRRAAGRYEALARKLAELDHAQKLHGEDIQLILNALRQFEDTTSWAYPEGRRLIGFQPSDSKKGSAKGPGR